MLLHKVFHKVDTSTNQVLNLVHMKTPESLKELEIFSRYRAFKIK